MAIVTLHANAAISKSTTFQRSILKAILDTDFIYTEIDSELVVLASADPSGPQYGFVGRNLAVDTDGTLHGIVERIEIFKNASALNPSVVHVLEGEQLLADLDASALLGSGPLASQNYGAFYRKLGSFGTDHEIQGSSGDDILEPLLNTSLVQGLGGNDTFLFYGGVTYDGGDGVDTLDLSASGRVAAVTFAKNLASDGNLSTLISIEGVIGGSQDDDITGNNRRNAIEGGGGSDEIAGGGGKDRLFGNAGPDIIYGGTDDDKIFGNGGNDALRGGDGDDTIKGGNENDTISGGIGADTLYGGNGDDFIQGGQWDDMLFGDDGDDHIQGGSGGDIINGGDRDDRLLGGEGNDELFGGKNRDRLIGGSDDDILYGGGGRDTFEFYPADFGNDTIMDFQKGKDILFVATSRDRVLVEHLGSDTIVQVYSSTELVTVIKVINVSLTIDDIFPP